MEKPIIIIRIRRRRIEWNVSSLRAAVTLTEAIFAHLPCQDESVNISDNKLAAVTTSYKLSSASVTLVWLSPSYTVVQCQESTFLLCHGSVDNKLLKQTSYIQQP